MMPIRTAGTVFVRTHACMFCRRLRNVLTGLAQVPDLLDFDGKEAIADDEGAYEIRWGLVESRRSYKPRMAMTMLSSLASSVGIVDRAQSETMFRRKGMRGIKTTRERKLQEARRWNLPQFYHEGMELRY
jgi:hypothetical protein